jgi:2'-5' RNA ligase
VTNLEAQSLDERWQAFQQLPQLRNHWWWRPGWQVGRSYYTWHVTFERAELLHRLTERLQAAIRTIVVDPVPMEGLHLTMQGVGFTHDVSDDDVAAIVEATRVRCQTVAAFSLTLGPVDPDAEGVGLLVAPWQPVIDLRLAVRAAIADVWGSDQVPDPEDGYRPHVTVAYSNSDASPAELAAVLVPLRTEPPVTVSVPAVQLIKLNRDHKVYRWDVVASVALRRSD